MIIDLTKSDIFKRDPDNRFSREYGVPTGTWMELWKRHKLLDYSNGDMRDYLFIKHARNLQHPTMYRWMVKTQIYEISRPLLKQGVKFVNTEIFGELEEFVMRELTKPLKDGAIHKADSII